MILGFTTKRRRMKPDALEVTTRILNLKSNPPRDLCLESEFGLLYLKFPNCERKPLKLQEWRCKRMG